MKDFSDGGGGSNVKGKRQPIVWPQFSKLHENEENWTGRGMCPKFYYVDPNYNKIIFNE